MNNGQWLAQAVLGMIGFFAFMISDIAKSRLLMWASYLMLAPIIVSLFIKALFG